MGISRIFVEAKNLRDSGSGATATVYRVRPVPGTGFHGSRTIMGFNHQEIGVLPSAYD